jgi:hypothetical protein
LFEKLYVEVEIFKNMLISKATGTEISHQEYKDRRGVPSHAHQLKRLIVPLNEKNELNFHEQL